MKHGVMCFCGNDDLTKVAKSVGCTTQCGGNDYQECGGSSATSVYDMEGRYNFTESKYIRQVTSHFASTV